MKLLMFLISGALIAGCAGSYDPSYRFKQVDVVNLSGGSLENLSWNVVGSGKTMNCSDVGDNQICADYFPQRPYPRAGIELNWTHVDGERKTEVLNPAVPAYFYTGLPLSIFVEIDPDGALNAFYRQDTSDNVIIPGG